ncbi:MAG: hypothetical protein A4E57_02694 [Syntrophorhabdaceae bacterium PtaU1.Bin034]|jgi:hypothetical protein|nr:MAG: hypothetical protein A4E57_02694 [Syntrophorhabdaceae bacterium PtaU1.Bin034]
MKRTFTLFTAVVLLCSSMLPAFAETDAAYQMEQQPAPGYASYRETQAPIPSGEEMVADLLIVRPFSLAALIVGAGMSILATPLAVVTGTTGPVYDRLLKEPFNFTVCRPLGAFDGS